RYQIAVACDGVVTPDGVDRAVRPNRRCDVDARSDRVAFDCRRDCRRTRRPGRRGAEADFAVIVRPHLTGGDVLELRRTGRAARADLDQPGVYGIFAPGVVHVELDRVVVDVAGAVGTERAASEDVSLAAEWIEVR